MRTSSVVPAVTSTRSRPGHSPGPPLNGTIAGSRGPSQSFGAYWTANGSRSGRGGRRPGGAGPATGA
ncbi:hypothetical protein FKR81_42005 [Lentzea tibetensis]|uniref:Uncharacterized protein n=1 Tax=Lentzea tibetensis TaxID=2591470 RepID=A0A563EFN9_9PSEU|nr:hypothetical protein FKR81_42005 [Lentzea tibetensis]